VRDFVEEQIPDERLRGLYLYWKKLRGERQFPTRAEIDPGAIPRLLPHVLLAELVGSRWRYRLVGTEAERYFRIPMTGRYLDEIMEGEYLTYLQALYHQLLTDRAPIYTESLYQQGLLHARRLMLPLSRDGSAVDMALCGQIFTFGRGHEGRSAGGGRDRTSAAARRSA
jgi:hypothetical protein